MLPVAGPVENSNRPRHTIGILAESTDWARLAMLAGDLTGRVYARAVATIIESTGGQQGRNGLRYPQGHRG